MKEKTFFNIDAGWFYKYKIYNVKCFYRFVWLCVEFSSVKYNCIWREPIRYVPFAKEYFITYPSCEIAKSSSSPSTFPKNAKCNSFLFAKMYKIMEKNQRKKAKKGEKQ